MELSNSNKVYHRGKKMENYMLGLISDSVQHKMNFFLLVQEMSEFERDSTLHRNVSEKIADYLNISSLRITKTDTQKIRKLKIREHLSSIKANICAILNYENLRSINCGSNHLNILFSIVNTSGFVADILIQIFEIYNIDFKSRPVRSIMLKPTMYVPIKTHNGYQNCPYYESLANEEWIEHTYIYNAASDFLSNYYSHPIYSVEFYHRATKLGFDFGYSYRYHSDSGTDIIRRLLDYTDRIDKDTFEFIELVFNNHVFDFNKEWFFRLTRMYSSYVWSEDPVNRDVAEYSDKFLEILGSKYSSWLGGNMNYWDIEYIVSPMMKISGSAIFLKKNEEMEKMMDRMLKGGSSNQCESNFYNIRRLMLLEQLVKEMDEDTDYSEFITSYRDTISKLGKCKYSIICELKKYSIRYGKEKSIKDFEKINVESPGYMQYSENRKWLAKLYSGSSITLPIIECDWNDENSQVLEYEPNEYDVRELEEFNETEYRRNHKSSQSEFYDDYDSDY